MVDAEARGGWRPARATLIAAGVVIAGMAFTGLSWWFLLLVALGTFGPGVLREMGWLNDRDEFQRRADHRAGYHAFLVTGILAFSLVAFVRSGDRAIESPQEFGTLFLVVLWFTWLVSSLLGYWGPRKTAARILVVFGVVWLAFAIVSNLGPEWTGWTALLLHPLLAAPFFVLAWLSRRWPRVTGVLLLVVSAFLFQFLGFFRNEHMAPVNEAVTFVLFLGPLISSGLALLAVRREDASEDPEELDGAANP